MISPQLFHALPIIKMLYLWCCLDQRPLASTICLFRGLVEEVTDKGIYMQLSHLVDTCNPFSSKSCVIPENIPIIDEWHVHTGIAETTSQKNITNFWIKFTISIIHSMFKACAFFSKIWEGQNGLVSPWWTGLAKCKHHVRWFIISPGLEHTMKCFQFVMTMHFDNNNIYNLLFASPKSFSASSWSSGKR